MKFTLSEEEIRKFNEKGFLIIKGLYKNYPYIEKIKSDINFISKLILKKNYTTMNVSDFTEFDSIYKYLLAIDKKKASLIYDAIKLLPFFNKWSHCDLHYTLSSTLLKSKLIGFCRTGDGIRADAPDNNFYAFPHQEFSAQGRSEQGLVFF
ncbi:MAG: hypothetical protein O7C59_04570 [Rickettsia endosymbiont of Ixodes persulcatus]|nr:hypothetical protein [Rickettsia endosymbiont of Ixodes persulcatus]